MRQQIKEENKQHKPSQEDKTIVRQHTHTHSRIHTCHVCVCWLMRANKFQRHLYLFSGFLEADGGACYYC